MITIYVIKEEPCCVFAWRCLLARNKIRHLCKVIYHNKDVGKWIRCRKVRNEVHRNWRPWSAWNRQWLQKGSWILNKHHKRGRTPSHPSTFGATKNLAKWAPRSYWIQNVPQLKNRGKIAALRVVLVLLVYTTVLQNTKDLPLSWICHYCHAAWYQVLQNLQWS